MKTSVVGAGALQQCRCGGLPQRARAPLQRPAIRAAFSQPRPRQQQLVHAAAAAAAEASSEPVVEVVPAEPEWVAVRKFLSSIGWDRAWVDVIAERIQKHPGLGASARTCQEVVDFLTGLGVPTQSVCNMAAVNHEIMAASTPQMQGVADYIRSRGVQGEMLVTMLEAYPKLLTFTAAGGVLEKGRTRASVDVSESPSGRKQAVVSFWREGATFSKSPVGPLKPESM